MPSSEVFFLYLFLLLVIPVPDVAPAFPPHVEFLSVFGDYVENPFLVNARKNTDSTVHPTFLRVVLNEDNLCAGLYGEFHKGGKAAFGKLAVDFPL